MSAIIPAAGRCGSRRLGTERPRLATDAALSDRAGRRVGPGSERDAGRWVHHSHKLSAGRCHSRAGAARLARMAFAFTNAKSALQLVIAKAGTAWQARRGTARIGELGFGRDCCGEARPALLDACGMVRKPLPGGQDSTP